MKPPKLTSTGSANAFNPASVHAADSSLYFSFFLSKAASILSSHGTVSSAMITIMAEVDQDGDRSLRPGQCLAVGKLNFSCVNFSCWFRSTLMFHSHPGVRTDRSFRLMFCAPAPCLMKCIHSWDVDRLVLFTSSLHASKTSASFLRTWSWCHPY